MKLLRDILYKAGLEDVIGTTNAAIDDICFDSRKVKKFSLFIATKGLLSDGHDFINQAVEMGASAVVCEKLPRFFSDKITYVKVKDSKVALGHIAANFYNNPSEKLQLIGVTGTNGKTTTASLLFELFVSLGYRCGLLSTVVNKIHKTEISATHTTPDAISLNALLATMVNDGCTHCFMEVSSHAIHQERISGLIFKVGLFTNITHDHLDYHKSFDEYVQVKKRFFDSLPENSVAIFNKDDSFGNEMVADAKCKIRSFGLKSISNYKCKILESQFSGMLLSVDGNEIWSTLIGNFNASNVLGIYAVAIELGEDKLEVLTGISKLKSVEGRFEYMQAPNGITGIVDYAHTPDALENVLRTIGEIRTGVESVITVIGCGGERDKGKRPLMAKIACDGSDRVILTSDNPRNEDPDEILKDMQKGVIGKHHKKTISITNRKEAIKTACSLAKSGDIILLAGKGHEKYQEIKGERFPFDDKQILTEMMEIT